MSDLTGRTQGEIDAGQITDQVLSRFLIGLRIRGGSFQEFSAASEVFLFRAIGEEAEMADALE